MATYEYSLGQTVGAGQDATFTMDAVSLPASEQFKRCKIGKLGSYLGYCELRGNAQTVLGGTGFDTWTTNKTAISWTNGGQPSVKVHNTDSAGHSWRIVVTIESEAITTFTITVNSATGGTCTASKSTSAAGATITLTPTPATGYQLTGYTTSPSVTVSNNKFTMPASNITITPVWTKISYAITTKASPSGGGTVSANKSTATMGTSVTLSQTPATGYFFNGWTSSPSLTISSNAFTMPAKAVTVTANYLKRSTASVNRKSLTGGGTVTLTISPDKSSYSHSYRLSFGTGMQTSWTTVAAGTTSVTISVPESWSNQIPTATSKTGGTLTVRTYSGSTNIGSYEITGFTYNVPASAVPTISNITKAIVRTIGGKTYANVGNYYVQGHCGVQVTAHSAGALGSTITEMAIAMVGYTGAAYGGTVEDDDLDFTSGLLTIGGTNTIQISATDGRGRTTVTTTTISVAAYTAPEGSLNLTRVDLGGTESDLGEYATFIMTKRYTQVGSNALSVISLTSQGVTVTPDADSGDLLPGTGNRQQFSVQQEYTITLTLTDSFETTVVTAKLPSGKFIFHIDADGDRLGFMKAVTKTIPTGKSSTVEFSGDSQIYIGDDKLEDYITKQQEYGAGSHTWTSQMAGWGWITSSFKELDLYLPMPSILPSGTTITGTELRIVVRGLEGYIDIFTYSNRNNNVIGTTGYTITFNRRQGGRILNINIQTTAAMTGASTSNTPVVINVYRMVLTTT